MPPVVYLLCGLTGSGKTTYAKRLEAGGAIRLSVDEEVCARHGRYGVDYPMSEEFDRERPVVEKLLAGSSSWSRQVTTWCWTTACGGEATATPTSAWSTRTAADGGCCTSDGSGGPAPTPGRA